MGTVPKLYCETLTEKILAYLTENEGYFPAWKIYQAVAREYNLDRFRDLLYALSKDGKIATYKNGRSFFYGRLGQPIPESRGVPALARDLVLGFFAKTPSATATFSQIWASSPQCSIDSVRKACFDLYQQGKLERAQEYNRQAVYRIAAPKDLASEASGKIAQC